MQTGELDGKSIEVIGGLHDGDEIAARGTDELRAGNSRDYQTDSSRDANSEVTMRQKYVPIRFFQMTKRFRR